MAPEFALSGAAGDFRLLLPCLAARLGGVPLSLSLSDPAPPPTPGSGTDQGQKGAQGGGKAKAGGATGGGAGAGAQDVESSALSALLGGLSLSPSSPSSPPSSASPPLVLTSSSDPGLKIFDPTAAASLILESASSPEARALLGSNASLAAGVYCLGRWCRCVHFWKVVPRAYHSGRWC